MMPRSADDHDFFHDYTLDYSAKEHGGDIKAAIAEHLYQRLSSVNFQGGRVLDVGANDGRFIPLLKRLGASEVIAIEPALDTLPVLDRERLETANAVFGQTLEDFSSNHSEEEYDGAVALNINASDPAGFVSSLVSVLNAEGTALISFAERSTYDRYRAAIDAHFSDVRINGQIGTPGWQAHKIVLICRQPIKAK